MINYEQELDSALARLVELQDQNEDLKRDNAELADALGAMVKAHSHMPEDLLAELGSLRRRNTELEAMLAARATG